ncbi:MAG: RelA/SpoT family protein [Burkholderiaceae bacterium]
MKTEASRTEGLVSLSAESRQARDFVMARLAAAGPDHTESGSGRSNDAVIAHAAGCAEILAELHADQAAIAAAWLFGLPKLLPLQLIEREFGLEVARVVESMRKLRRLRELSLSSLDAVTADNRHDRSMQAGLETLRRMLLALSVDVRVVLLRLASRLQTLRRHAEQGTSPSPQLCHETLEVLAPLANRLGIGALKWQLEDLAFRFLEPERYKALARGVLKKRVERERLVRDSIDRLKTALTGEKISATVFGRSKHLYSLASKMAKKRLAIDQIHDLHAFRIIVSSVPDCYNALDVVHRLWTPEIDQYSDYISAPKNNGYQSLHTVVRNSAGDLLEVQIRTNAMDEAAEYGGAAHWQYKEGLGSTTGASGGFEQRVAWLRQLLVWQREIGHALGAATASGQPDSTIYALTPQGRVIALPAGSTPIDFAYHLHTELGHRCRGAKVNGAMVPLTRVLQTGESVEIVVAKGQDAGSAGPSRDWLNPQQHYLASHRARGKVRHWFAARESAREQQAGRAIVDRAIAHESAGSVSLEKLAEHFGLEAPGYLFTLAFKGEIGPRAIEQALRELKQTLKQPASEAAGSAGATGVAGVPPEASTPVRLSPRGQSKPGDNGVLIEGVGSLLTQLAKCCRPVPPDEIAGFITQGKGITVHRDSCRVFQQLLQRAPERTVAANWAGQAGAPVSPSQAGSGESAKTAYPVDLEISGTSSSSLMHRVAEILAREQIPLLASEASQRGESGLLRLTVGLKDGAGLPALLSRLQQAPEVTHARRR